jgi:hypothetical protein
MKLNGNLVLNTDATGELQNVYIERLSAVPTFNSAQKGRVVFNTTTATFYFNDGTAWTAFATGGNASALQAEVDAVEASLGTAVNANGTFNGSAAFTNSIIAGSASITDAINALATYAIGKDTLAELGDVSMGTYSQGQYLKLNTTTGKWYNETFVASDITDVTATAAELNTLHGITATTAELNYSSGVTSGIQGQLDNKQPLNTGLTNFAASANGSGTGIIVQTAPNTFVDRTIVGPSSGVTVTNGNGVAGAPTINLTHNLAALEALADGSTGFIVKTGAGTFTSGISLISGSASRIVVTNGDGVAASPTVDLATVANAGGGSFLKFSSDAYGRITGTSPVVTGDITALVDSTYVNVAGDSMTGNLTMTSGATVTGLPTPTAGTDAANKNYVDGLVSGLTWKTAVKASSVGNLTLSGEQTVDGIALVAGDRILVKNQTTTSQNGIYIVSATGWARAADMDAATEFEGSAVFVQEGNTQADTGWVQTLAVTTVGTDPVHFNQFTGSSVLTAGVGLSQVANTLNVNLGAAIAQLPTGDVGLDLANVATSALILQLAGAPGVRSTDTDSQLALLLKSAGGLTQDAAGLYIPAGGVANVMLANSTITLDVDGGNTGSIALGGTLSILGDSVKGLSSSISGSTVSLTIADATTASKGVSSFDSGDFTVTAGVVSIKANGVDNGQLANSTIGYSGTTGGVQVAALGTSISFVGGSAPVTTVSAAGSVTINVADATASSKGLASFSATDFNVTSGAVSLVAKGLNSLTDVATSGDAAGQTLVYSAASSKFINRPTYYLYTSGGPATSHVVTHSLGQKYCNVTVVDSTDEVVIPQSITFNSDTQLTVTFTSAIDCFVIVMGVNAA